MASHPIVVLLDDDDTLRDNAIEVLVNSLLRFPEAAASFGDHTFTDLGTNEHHPNHFTFLPHYERFRRLQPLRKEATTGLYGRNLYYALLDGNLLGQPWAVWRHVYQEIGGFYSGVGSADDWDVYLRLLRGHLVTVTSQIVSDHFREPGRVHLTTEDGQFEKQMLVLRRELDRSGILEVRTRLVLHRRMGMYYKTIGDRLVPGDTDAALTAYRRSAAWWPFDHVVIARMLMGPITHLRR